MRRVGLIALLLTATAAAAAGGAGADNTNTYKIEMFNAFGIVEGSDVRVSGVNAGQVTALDINEDKRAVITVEVDGELAQFGEKTRCSSEPQSLIAEYFVDCDPQGPPMPEGGTVPASRVTQTVQTDLVQNTLRDPYKRRLQLLINEFGTALAGNPETLNEAIRLGAPALTETRQVTRILADQNRIIRDLNVNSDRVIGELTRVREDVVDFVDEAEDAAAASATRREDLSRDFELLDDFLAELNPTLVDLEGLARDQTPLLTDLRAAAPGLNRLALNLPAFNEASEISLESLGDASLVGRKALRRGRDEIGLLADAGKKAPVTAETLADFVRDIDDPRRAVEIDDRAAVDTGRKNEQPGTKRTKGYTGFESFLNWLYYLTGATAQFDQVAHTMHVNFFTLDTGPCTDVVSGRDPETGKVGVPAEDGGTTRNFLETADCVQWLGPTQPGINEDIGLPPYPSAVCPKGTEPEAAEHLCSPNETASSGPAQVAARGDGGAGAGSQVPAPAVPQDQVPDDVLDDLLGLPGQGGGGGLGNLPNDLQDTLEGLGNGLGGGLGGGGGQGASGGSGGGAAPMNDLLDFLFSS